MTPKGWCIIKRCDLVGVGVILLKEVCHYGDGLWGHIYVQATPSKRNYFLMPASQDVGI
ncbi:hypothetical protein I79_001933 [Cricetulus griseus]|uniref:Uncharacterized protein n=1 Tax=Cricetulus griseus TaxID=10029 RepID=G3GW22_CRIGR|nr:hypothetical protein I79_001933 [Cricetulus griseus]